MATEILDYAASELGLGTEPIKFLEPGFNTGSSYSALLRVFPDSVIQSATGYEIDLHYGNAARSLWVDTPLVLHLQDFTTATPAEPGERANLLVCNPPYVRHHHIAPEVKIRLQREFEKRTGVKMSGLSGLYCYFMGLAHTFMEAGGVAGWLVPSEFMDVNYGLALKQYLLTRVTLLHVHRFDANDVQFADAYVSSAVVWFKNCRPAPDHVVKFTFGGTLSQPSTESLVSIGTLKQTRKWTQLRLGLAYKTTNDDPVLSSLFDIRRGLATGSNAFFMLTPETIRKYEIPSKFLTPILPSPRQLPITEVHADEQGHPIVDHQLFLLTCDEREDLVRTQHAGLWRYLQMGIETGVNEGYLCSRRTPWYSQENRPAAPILCTYMGRKSERGGPFRFILNHSDATATNTYLMMYPKHSSLSAYLEGNKTPGCANAV